VKAVIRSLDETELAAYAAMVAAIDSETRYMDYADGERSGNVKKITARFGQPDSLYYVLACDGRLEGYFEVHGMRTAKKRHVAFAVGGVLRKHYGTGLGAALVQRALRAASGRWRKIEMSVIEGNASSMQVAKYFGFAEEGFRREAVLVDNTYLGEHLLGLHFAQSAHL
jgi:RimJ/RimL family protein N-acetyltransferase